MDRLWIEQHHFDSRIALPHGLAQFLGVEVGQPAIEKKHLPEATFQVDQRFGPSCGLFETASRGTQTFEDALTHYRAGTGHQNVISIVVWAREGRHTVDLKRIRLEGD